MKKWLSCSLALVFSLQAAGPARADCVPEAQASRESDCVVMERDGQRGLWLSLGNADRQRRLALEVPELRLQIQRLERLGEVQTLRLDAYREAARLRSEALTTANQQLEASLAREVDLRRELGAWYRSPALWVVVGALAASVVVIAVTAAD